MCVFVYVFLLAGYNIVSEGKLNTMLRASQLPELFFAMQRAPIECMILQIYIYNVYACNSYIEQMNTALNGLSSISSKHISYVHSYLELILTA